MGELKLKTFKLLASVMPGEKKMNSVKLRGSLSYVQNVILCVFCVCVQGACACLHLCPLQALLKRWSSRGTAGRSWTS